MYTSVAKVMFSTYLSLLIFPVVLSMHDPPNVDGIKGLHVLKLGSHFVVQLLKAGTTVSVGHKTSYC